MMRSPLRYALIVIAACAPAFAQIMPAPFEDCQSAPLPELSLTIDTPDHCDWTVDPAVPIHIWLPNISDHPGTVFQRRPEHSFSANVTTLSGQPVELTPAGVQLYSPLPPNSVWVESNVGSRTLQPQEELTYKWEIGREFDLSRPGYYYVSLGYDPSGKLDDMVCSNRLAITVPDPHSTSHKES